MIINLFSVPVFIGSINCKKINLKNKKFTKTWLSETLSTFDQSLDEKGKNLKDVNYLLKTIVSILEEKIKYPFKITLENIWQNSYIENDYQESHIHRHCDFSFIIYKKVSEGRTVFINPLRNYFLFYKNTSYMYDEFFMPKCKTGQIIIFPSFLEHMVLKSKNQTTISGNLTFKKL